MSNDELQTLIGDRWCFNSEEIISRKLDWHGHMVRQDGILIAIQDAIPDGSRRRPGRPKRRWMDDIRARITNHRYNLRNGRQRTTRSTAL